MAIAEQFAGLDMENLIGAPLSAASNASTQLANSTADFINRVGFDNTGKVRTAEFMYQKRSVNQDGTSNLEDMKVDVPMLAIIPIPNLQVDEVNVLFDMEVKQTEKHDSSLDVGATLSGSMRLGFIKVSVSGSVSVHQANTRSSDNSAKYHVDVRATNHGTPEGLARVLDMMAANVAPTLVGSTLKDENGQDLSVAAKARAENLKKITQEISQLNHQLDSAKDSLATNIAQLKSAAQTQNNAYHTVYNKSLEAAQNDDERDKLDTAMGTVNETWTNLLNQAGNMIEMIAASSQTQGSQSQSGQTQSGQTQGQASQTTTVSEVFGLKAFDYDETNKVAKVDEYKDGISYKSIAIAQDNAVKQQQTVKEIENKIVAKKNDYSNVSNRTA